MPPGALEVSPVLAPAESFAGLTAVDVAFGAIGAVFGLVVGLLGIAGVVIAIIALLVVLAKKAPRWARAILAGMVVTIFVQVTFRLVTGIWLPPFSGEKGGLFPQRTTGNPELENQTIVDEWSLLHVAGGALFGVAGIPPVITVPSLLAFEVIENTALVRTSFQTRPDSLGNMVADLILGLAGFTLGVGAVTTGAAMLKR